MNIHDLKMSYQEHLHHHGVDLEKARQAAEKLSLEELLLISEIWKDWSIHHPKIKLPITISDI